MFYLGINKRNPTDATFIRTKEAIIKTSSMQKHTIQLNDLTQQVVTVN